MRKICSSSKHRVEGVVELLRALQVGPERLLHDHAGVLGEAAVAQHVDTSEAAAGGTLR